MRVIVNFKVPVVINHRGTPAELRQLVREIKKDGFWLERYSHKYSATTRKSWPVTVLAKRAK